VAERDAEEMDYRDSYEMQRGWTTEKLGTLMDTMTHSTNMHNDLKGQWSRL